jgi:hypothetical protein
LKNQISFLDHKAIYLGESDGEDRIRLLKAWLKKSKAYDARRKVRCYVHRLSMKKLPIYLSFIRWVYIDILRGKVKRKHGIYQFVALPGEGKTMSMVSHMERFRNECREKGVEYVIATNFKYRHNDYFINHWTDMVTISKRCYKENIRCLIALDEIHITFDSADWKNFPAEILAMLSFNRKYGLQFLCSSQIYEASRRKSGTSRISPSYAKTSCVPTACSAVIIMKNRIMRQNSRARKRKPSSSRNLSPMINSTSFITHWSRLT